MESLDIALKVSLVLFMVGNLLHMGLRLKLQEAFAGLRNTRFVVQSIVWGFVLCPALAYLLAKIVPLDPAYGMGLILLGMAPCAPFLPPMVERARGDMGSAAAFMILASIVTVVYMPIAVPVMVTGLSTDAWTIAKPLLFFSVATAASYGLSFGLPRSQKSVLALGMSTRNLGAALAPLFAVQALDQRAIVMVALGVPMQRIFSLLAARWFRKQAEMAEPTKAPTAVPTKGPHE